MNPILNADQYKVERAICDKAAAYAESVMCEGGSKRKRNYLTKEEALHPDYAACDNDMRGRVDQYEILTELPERVAAYVGNREPNGMGVDRMAGRSYPLQVWTGLQIGNCTLVERKGRNRFGEKSYQCYATIQGNEYEFYADGKRAV